MTTTIRNAAAAASLLAALALPLTAQAATTTTAQPQHYTLQTRTFDEYHAGENDGSLALTVYPNGIIQGTYRDLDSGGFKQVTGGLGRGDRVWLDVGNGVNPVHLTGTFRNGKLETTVADVPGPDRVMFESVPAHA